jgi:hypothetical protein
MAVVQTAFSAALTCGFNERTGCPQRINLVGGQADLLEDLVVVLALARGYLGGQGAVVAAEVPGPFTVVDDGLIAHHVEVSLLRNWIGGIQYRKARLQNSCLELSPREPILIHGEPRNAKLVWRRTRINQ